MVQFLIHAGADINAYEHFEKEEFVKLLGLKYHVAGVGPKALVWDLFECRTPCSLPYIGRGHRVRIYLQTRRGGSGAFGRGHETQRLRACAGARGG